MTSRHITVSASLAIGHAALFGLFWLLLQVPESNVAMLLLSAVLVGLLVTLGAWVEGAGLLAWRPGVEARQIPKQAALAMPAVLIGAIVFWLFWWISGSAMSSWTMHRGEIDAWVMLRFGWTRTAPLHTTASWIATFVRYGLGLSFALAATGGVIASGARGIIAPAWLERAVSPIRLVCLTSTLLLFFYLPWRVVNWRPSSLAANWQELGFVAVKLGLIYVIANVGWSFVLRIGKPPAVGADASVTAPVAPIPPAVPVETPSAETRAEPPASPEAAQ